MVTTVLLTYFEPFGGEAENASEAAVALLADSWSEPDVRLVTARLSVAFERAGQELARLLAEHQPDAVVATGEAGGRAVVTPETTARNLDDARIPDNTGSQPRQRRIEPAGPDELPTRLDVDALLGACRSDGIEAAPSNDAGGFLCNHVFHHLMRHTDLPGGFVHLPALRSVGRPMVGAETDDDASAVTPRVTLEQCARALGHAVRLVSCHHRGDRG